MKIIIIGIIDVGCTIARHLASNPNIEVVEHVEHIKDIQNIDERNKNLLMKESESIAIRNPRYTQELDYEPIKAVHMRPVFEPKPDYISGSKYKKAHNNRHIRNHSFKRR